MTEDEIAGLDGDWAEFTPAERAAYAFARKLTYELHNLTDADIDLVRKHYTELQILEMALSIAGNNSTNRWKEGAGIPQSSSGGGFGRRRDGEAVQERPATHTYLTPTSEKFTTTITKVVPLQFDVTTGKPIQLTICPRVASESRAEVEAKLDAARKRTPRLPLVTEATARELLPEDWPSGPLPQWVRLLANFPKDGTSRIITQRNADEKGNLTPLLKAQVSWIIARHDGAWYAAGEAYGRLKRLGWSDDQIYALDGSWKEFTPAERAQFVLARNLSAAPIVLTDDEVDEALKFTSPRDVVQLIRYTTVRASFDRITEAAGLQVDD